MQRPTDEFIEKCFSGVFGTSGKILGLNDQYTINSVKAVLKY